MLLKAEIKEIIGEVNPLRATIEPFLSFLGRYRRSLGGDSSEQQTQSVRSCRAALCPRNVYVVTKDSAIALCKSLAFP